MSNLPMTEAEIVRNYVEAKKKTHQITILADMNLTTTQEIRKILEKNGAIAKKAAAVKVTKEKIAPAQHENVEKTESEGVLPETVKEAISKQMIEEQEAIDYHSARLKELYNFLTGGAYEEENKAAAV